MTSESDLFYEEKLARQRASADAIEERERTRVVSRLRSLAMEMEFVGENYMGHLSEAQASRFHAATYIVRDLVGELTGEKP